MSTRAAQIELLTGPLIDPTTGDICAGYTAYFYAAGTSNVKNVWTEKEKTNPFTSYALDSGGKVLLYGDGIYKIVIKNPDGTTVLSLDNQKVQATTFSVVQKTEAYTATPDDDVILCSGTWSLSLQTVEYFEHALDIVNIGSGTITVDPSGVQTIGEVDATVALGAGQRMRIVPDQDSTVWRRVDFSNDINGVEFILDVDGDTSITADTDDQIDFKTGGTDRLSISNTAIIPTVAFDLNAKELILDADADTSITADTDDQIDIKVSGADQIAFKDGVIEPTTDNDITLGSASKQFSTAYFENAIAINSITQGKDTVAPLNSKIIEIGDWNMDSTASLNVAHGLTYSKIRMVSAIIRSDDGTVLYPLTPAYITDQDASIAAIDATNVVLNRYGTGSFDNANFDATSYNRGWVTIHYVD